MLTDRYELPVSTASSAARDAYVEGCAAKLTMYPGAIKGFDRAIPRIRFFASGPCRQGAGAAGTRGRGGGARVDGGGNSLAA